MTDHTPDVRDVIGEAIEGLLADAGYVIVRDPLGTLRHGDELPRPIQAGDRVRPVDDGYSMIGTVEHVARGKAWVCWDADDDLASADTVWDLWGLVRVDDEADR